MGCEFSKPPAKTKPVKGSTRKRGTALGNEYTQEGRTGDVQKVLQGEGGGRAEIHPYFSFATFFNNMDRPHIFEWEFKEEIGRGSMSRVFLAQNTATGDYAAGKEYNKGLLQREVLQGEEPPYAAVQREIEIMAQINHRYILPIIEVIDDNFTNSVILMIPYAESGTLQHQLDMNNVPEETLAVCFHQVAEGLKYIHGLNIVHRDIKPENILVFTETFFCLSDFSASTQLQDEDELLTDTKGSPAFLAPEECDGEPFHPKPADVWAYGVSLYRALFGKLPFKLDQGQGKTLASTVYTVTQLIKEEPLVFPKNIGVSNMATNLLEQILKKDPENRPTFEQIVTSPWFKDARKVDEENIRLQQQLEAEYAQQEGSGK